MRKSGKSREPTLCNTLTPTPTFLVCSGRSAKQHSCRPLFSLHSDTSGAGHQSFLAPAPHCVLYTPKTKHHREDKENARTHGERKMWGKNSNQLVYCNSQLVSDTFASSASIAFLSRTVLSIRDCFVAHSYRKDQREDRESRML